MREVSHFVVVFPDRLIMEKEERALLLGALRREYPHYQFDEYPGRYGTGRDEFSVIPVVGALGDGPSDDPDKVYMCKPLDPRVIPDLVETLKLYEGVGAVVN